MTVTNSIEITKREYGRLQEALIKTNNAYRHIGIGKQYAKEQIEGAMDILDDLVWRLGNLDNFGEQDEADGES